MTKLIMLSTIFFSFLSCSLFDSNDSLSHKVNVTVNDQQFKMYANSGFYKFVDHDNSEIIMNIWRAKNQLPQVWIYLPTDVIQGKIYSEKDIQSGFTVFYASPNDEGYEVSEDLSFRLEITKWEGVGGKAEGLFYGVIRKSFTTGDDTLSITNGNFETTITDEIKRP